MRAAVYPKVLVTTTPDLSPSNQQFHKLDFWEHIVLACPQWQVVIV